MDLFLIAAEPSADLLGAHLVEALLNSRPELHITGVLGPKLREKELCPAFPMEDFCVMGFFGILRHLPRLMHRFFTVKKWILEKNPKVVLTIDYPGFNLRLAASLKKSGFKGKIVHYVCPSVWAWGRNRISQMEQNLDALLTIFPFEKALFKKNQLIVDYVGHPLNQIPLRDKPGCYFGVFPGSRKAEIEQNFPYQLEIIQELIRRHPEIPVGISIANASFEKRIRELVGNLPVQFFPKGQTQELMRKSRVALATSGTATLELALHLTPTVAQYAIRPIDCFLAQKVLKINLPFYCIVNILGSKEIFPEFFGPKLKKTPLLNQVLRLFEEPPLHTQKIQECLEIRTLLGDQNAAKAAAHRLISLAF